MFKRLGIVLSLWAFSLAGAGFSIGQYTQGGVIFFLTPDRGHGLVAAITDQDGGTGIHWSAQDSTTNACLDGILFGPNYSVTAGSLNTEQIASLLGDEGAAAAACKNYSAAQGGITFHDWFLPSFNELILLYLNREIINSVSLANGGTAFQEASYWSSVEASSESAKCVSFDSSSPSGNLGNKGMDLLRVRAIRSF